MAQALLAYQGVVQQLLTCIGGLVALRWCVSLLHGAYVNFFARCDVKTRYAAAGSWAVVTGGSDGIGRAFSRNLAGRGMNVAIVALDDAVLQRTAAELQSSFPLVSILAIPFDFNAASDSEFADLYRQLDTLSIGILVNNVGVFYKFPHMFADAKLSDDLRMLKINCESTLRMTKYVVPKMKAAHCGGIVNISSVSGVMTSPGVAAYAATKAYVRSLSAALAVELKPHGIDVLVVTPNAVATTLTTGYADRTPQTGFLMRTPEEVASGALRVLGVVNETAGATWHALIQPFIVRTPPTIIHRAVENRVEGWRKLEAEALAQRAAQAKKSA